MWKINQLKLDETLKCPITFIFSTEPSREECFPNFL